MIPKKIHLQWVFDELPPWADFVVGRYHSMMPDYDIRLMTSLPDGVPDELMTFLADERIATACRADLLRFWTLSTEGGFYADFDSIPLKPFDDLCGHGFVCAWANGRPGKSTAGGHGWIDCCLLGSEAGHPFWDVVFERCRDHASWRQANAWFAPVNTFPMREMESHGVTMLDDAIQEVTQSRRECFFDGFAGEEPSGDGYIRHFRMTEVLNARMGQENHWRTKTWKDIYGG